MSYTNNCNKLICDTQHIPNINLSTVIVSATRPRSGATISRLGRGDYRVTYARAGPYIFRCKVRDNEGLTGYAQMIITVKDMFGMSKY